MTNATLKFTVDDRYKHISINYNNWDELCDIEEWCYNSGKFEVYATGIVYERDQDLTAFLLKWA